MIQQLPIIKIIEIKQQNNIIVIINSTHIHPIQQHNVQTHIIVNIKEVGTMQQIDIIVIKQNITQKSAVIMSNIKCITKVIIINIIKHTNIIIYGTKQSKQHIITIIVINPHNTKHISNGGQIILIIIANGKDDIYEQDIITQQEITMIIDIVKIKQIEI